MLYMVLGSPFLYRDLILAHIFFSSFLREPQNFSRREEDDLHAPYWESDSYLELLERPIGVIPVVYDNECEHFAGHASNAFSTLLSRTGFNAKGRPCPNHSGLAQEFFWQDYHVVGAVRDLDKMQAGCGQEQVDSIGQVGGSSFFWMSPQHIFAFPVGFPSKPQARGAIKERHPQVAFSR